MSYLDHFPADIRREEIMAVRQERQAWINQPKKGFLRYRTPAEQLQAFRAQSLDCAADIVRIGASSEVTEQQRSRIAGLLRAFMPWRKGPFDIFGVEVDAEWRSERKWARIVPELPDLTDKVVADIGCNNGYYMFRMTPYRPRFVLGFEPSAQHYYCFKALNAMAGCANLDIDLLGVEHIALFEQAFDVVFLLGVIYHRASPVEVLRDVWAALKPNGRLIIESQAIAGTAPMALFPEKTYAKVPGTYFVPTAVCLKNWLLRAGFAGVEIFCSHPMSSVEQRRTEWMQFESYSDFLDPGNDSLTVEGYPAPWRVFLKAIKP